jgi:hypothetical protein
VKLASVRQVSIVSPFDRQRYCAVGLAGGRTSRVGVAIAFVCEASPHVGVFGWTGVVVAWLRVRILWR